MKNGIWAESRDYSVTNGKITFLTEGLYTFWMTNAAITIGNASACVTLNVNAPTGIAETTANNLKVYPNPTTGQLTIVNSIDISHLPAGVYFLKINDKTVKVIKQ